MDSSVLYVSLWYLFAFYFGFARSSGVEIPTLKVSSCWSILVLLDNVSISYNTNLISLGNLLVRFRFLMREVATLGVCLQGSK